MKFTEWLPAQAERDDAVGDLARFAKKSDFPITPNRKDMQYALADHKQPDLMDAVNEAVDEWDGARASEARKASVDYEVSQVEAVQKAEQEVIEAAEAKEAERVASAPGDPRVDARAAQEKRDNEVAARRQAEIDKAAEQAPKKKKAPKKTAAE